MEGLCGHPGTTPAPALSRLGGQPTGAFPRSTQAPAQLPQLLSQNAFSDLELATSQLEVQIFTHDSKSKNHCLRCCKVNLRQLLPLQKCLKHPRSKSPNLLTYLNPRCGVNLPFGYSLGCRLSAIGGFSYQCEVNHPLLFPKVKGPTLVASDHIHWADAYCPNLFTDKL